MTSLRFAYTQRNANAGAVGYAPLLPLALEAEFDICFYRSQLEFDVTPKPTTP